MKKLITITITIVAIVLVLMFNTATLAENYILAGFVTAVDIDLDEVEVTTDTGEVWAFYGADGFAIGEVCVMKMSDNFTPHNAYDDIVVVAGHFLGK